PAVPPWPPSVWLRANWPPPSPPPSTCSCRSAPWARSKEKPGPLARTGSFRTPERLHGFLPVASCPWASCPAFTYGVVPDVVAPALAGTRPGILPCVAALSPDACHPATFPTGRPATPASVREGG